MRPTHDPLPRAAWQGVVRLASAPWWLVRISGAVVRRFRGVAHSRPGRRPDGSWGHRPDDGGLTRHNLQSVRGANLVGPGRYAGSPTRS